MEKPAGKKDPLARTVGILVFLLGVGILVLVFLRSYGLFSATPTSLVLPPSPHSPPATTGNLSGAALTLVAQIGLLFVMTIVGSLVAARGIQLYLVACDSHEEPKPRRD